MAELTPALLVLSAGALPVAIRLRGALPGAEIFGLEGRVTKPDQAFTDFGGTVRTLFAEARPLVGLCSAGILIRTLAPLLAQKLAEPPVLAVAEDGSAVVPLLGAGTGAHALAERIGAVLGTVPAITGSGARRFGVNLLDPPPGYELLNPEAAKTFLSDLLAGGTVWIEGKAPWLTESRLPLAASPASASHSIAVSEIPEAPQPNQLVYRCTRLPGRLAIIGLGPGDLATRTPAVAAELVAADDVLGYAPYVAMAGPFRPPQRLHPSDNRVELDRARAAFALAAEGRRVVLVSSGDAGVFGMAAAAFEALERGDPRWHEVDLVVLPGVSAAFAAAAAAGAPLGHDFAILSLSDNLKPWSVIERRLDAVAAADLALALYNPVSRARPHQLRHALATIGRHRDVATPVTLGSDIGRPGERLVVTTLGRLDPAQVDSRTVILVGSSRTRTLVTAGREWVYTPRGYPPAPP